MKKLLIFCLTTPFIVFILSTVLSFGLFYSIDESNRIYHPIPIESLLPLYAVLSISLFSCCFNLIRKIRESAFWSFISFFWIIIPLCIIFHPLVILFLNILFVPYILILTGYFIWFRTKVNNENFETDTTSIYNE